MIFAGLAAPVPQPGPGAPGPAESHGVSAAAPGGLLAHPQPGVLGGGGDHRQVRGGGGRAQQLQPRLLVSRLGTGEAR